MMKVLHIISTIEDQSAGPSQSVPAMCNGLVNAGLDVSLFTLERLPREAKSFKFKTCVYPWGMGPRKLGNAPKMLCGLKDAAQNAQIIHSHNLWMMPNIYPLFATRDTQCRHICSPRGCLTEYSLSRSKWVKRIMWMLYQKRVLDSVAMFHATCEAELLDIRRLGFRQPVAIVSNGVKLPDLTTLPPKPTSGRFRLLYLSRIHQDKRVDLLLEAWQTLEKKHPDWDLEIYGPITDFAHEMMALAATLGLERATFKGEAKGDEKYAIYRACDLFTLPTRGENFGMVVAESLACETPVITTSEAPWSGLADSGGAGVRSGYWVPTTREALTEALDVAMSLTRDRRNAMGAEGRKWMERDFSWNNLGVKMKVAYEWICNPHKVAKPDWIIDE